MDFLTEFRSRIAKNDTIQSLWGKNELEKLTFVYNVLKYADEIYTDRELKSPDDYNLIKFFESISKIPSVKPIGENENYHFVRNDVNTLSETNLNGNVYMNMHLKIKYKDYYQSTARKINSQNIGKELAPYNYIEIIDPYFASETTSKAQLKEKLENITQNAKTNKKRIVYNNKKRPHGSFYEKPSKQIEDTAEILGINKVQIECKEQVECEEHDRYIVTNTCFYILGNSIAKTKHTHLTSYPIYKYNAFLGKD